MTRIEEALARLRDAVIIAAQDGASETQIRTTVEEGLAYAEAARPRAAEALADYRERFGHAA